MKQGKSLTDLAAEVERQSISKNDYLAESGEITMHPFNSTIDIDNNVMAMTNHCHKQVASWSGIGTRYYQKMLADNQTLLAGNVNHWLHHKDNAKKTRMVRELDGSARAFLSDRYLRLDNDVVTKTCLEVMSQIEGIQIKSCDITNNKLYMKAVFPKTEAEVKLNDPVQCGVVITNSEIGTGSFQISPLIYRLVCLNGMVSPTKEDGVRRNHLGSKINSDTIKYSSDTIELMAQATLAECKDAIKTFSSPEYFDKHVQKMALAADSIKSVNPEKTVELLAKQLAFTEDERSSVLEAFIRDQDYSQYGAMNAVTNAANNMLSYDRASDFEVMGSSVLNLNSSQWQKVALAA